MFLCIFREKAIFVPDLLLLLEEEEVDPLLGRDLDLVRQLEKKALLKNDQQAKAHGADDLLVDQESRRLKK